MFVVQSEFAIDRHLGYWVAHRSLGGSLGQRVWQYGALRRWRDIFIENLVFHMSMAVSIEAALSYLDFGIQPPHLSYGNILSAHYHLFLKGHWLQLGVTVVGMAVAYMLPMLFLVLRESSQQRQA